MIKNNRKSFILCETSNHQLALTKAFATWGFELLPSRKRFRQGCQAWSARPDESVCDLEGGGRRSSQVALLSSVLPGLVSSPCEPLPSRKCLRHGCQAAGPGQFALTKAFATWEGPSPSQVAHVFVRAARPGQFALTKAFATWGSELLPSRKRFRQGCQACSARPDESICDLRGARTPPSRKCFRQSELVV